MNSFKVEGGVKLSGDVTPQGAKNEALQILCATLLTSEKVIIENVPEIIDVLRLIDLLKILGVKIEKISNNKYSFEAKNIDLAAIKSDDYQSKAKSSFLNWVVNALKRGEKIKVVDDQFNNPTWTNSISVVIDRAIRADLNGLIHWGDFDWISRYDFANKIADKFNLQSNLIEPIKTEELNQVAPRPLNGGLDTTLAQDLLRLEPPQIDDCLDQIIENLK